MCWVCVTQLLLIRRRMFTYIFNHVVDDNPEAVMVIGDDVGVEYNGQVILKNIQRMLILVCYNVRRWTLKNVQMMWIIVCHWVTRCLLKNVQRMPIIMYKKKGV